MNIQIKNKTIGFILLVLLLAKSFSLSSQIISQTTHYSVDNGLSENHVLCMLQDWKGVMWFGTYDGLNKFDGYTFRHFKGRVNQKYQLSNYRVDRLKEDKQGHLWLQTNDSRIYRFDPVTETFLPVPQCIKEFSDYKKPLNKIEVLRDGTIWLSSNETGKEDCFRVENIPQSEGIRLTHFPVAASNVPNKISKIYLDQYQDTWLLTSTGIDLVKKNASTASHLFKQNAGALLSMIETDTNNYIGGEHGILWIFNKKNKTFELRKTPHPVSIIDIQKINNDELFILTNSSFFYVYHPRSGNFTEFRLDKQKKQAIYGCYKDKSNNFWIDTDNPGSLFFNPAERSIQYLPVDTTGYVNPRSLKFSITEDKFNNIWVLTHAGGFYRYNKQLRMLEPISERGDDEKSISNLTHSALADKQGNIWLSTYLQGVDKIVYRHSPFSFTKPVDAVSYNPKNEIRSVYQDSHHLLWVGSKKGYVYIYDQNGKLKGYLGSDGRLNSKTPFNSPVYDIKEDHNGTIWLCTKGSGLYRLTPQAGFNFSIVNYRYDPQNIYSINSNSVYSVFEDSKNRIWVGTFWGGLNLLDTQAGEIRFINSRNKLSNYPADVCIKIRCFSEDKNGQILAGTTQGLLVFNPNRKKPEDMHFRLFQHEPANFNSMSGNNVQYISVARNGDVYLSMIGGGVDAITGGIRPNIVPRFSALNSTDGTPINAVYTITDDGKDNLWMSTQTQVFRYHLPDKKLECF
ncbi:MAG: two-component regulator propeller domain-containing protein [Paludibacter sp.]